jgi:predicted membrane protein
MKMNKKVILRLIRNIIIALLSAGWIVPTIQFLIIFLRGILSSYEELPPELSYLQSVGSDFFYMFALSFFIIAAIWLAAVIIFWTIVAAGRLWPIRPKEDKEKQNK